MSTVKTNRIENEAGDGVNVSTLAQMALGSMKNKLIKGDKRVNQRV